MDVKLGLDIGSHSIKLIEIAKDGSNIKLLAAGSSPTPPKSLTSEIKADHEALANSIKKLVKDTGARSKKIQIALPESQVFTRVIQMPQLSKQELSTAIRWEAEQYVPLPIEQVNVDFTILREGKETEKMNMEVLLVACPKVLLDKYLRVLDFAELEPGGAETEIIAASRALVRTTPNLKNVMVVSLGAQTSDFSIVRNGILSYTRSISAGGEALSRALVQGLNFNQMQAEEFKRTYGLKKDKLEGKVLEAIKPVMDTIISEIKRAIAFYQEKQKDNKVESILITGGTAKLPGMVLYIAEEVGIEVQLGNPWLGITKDNRFNVLDNEGVSFAVAVGLALR